MRGLEDRFGQLGARTDADKVHVGDLALQLFGRQRARDRFYIGVARAVQQLQGTGVDTFQQ
ncbi:hypothetical protein D3C80_1824440 [compost metagenome]